MAQKQGQRERRTSESWAAMMASESNETGKERTSTEQYTILVDPNGIDDGIVAREIVHERSIGASPFLDVVASTRARSERILGRMDGERSHRLVVVCQSRHRLACRKIPESARAK